MTEEFARLTVRDLSGVFAARRLGRELAAGLALERQDQVRVATALSEVCRSAVTAGETAVIAFAADPAHLVLTVAVDGEVPEDGVAGAARPPAAAGRRGECRSHRDRATRRVVVGGCADRRPGIEASYRGVGSEREGHALGC